MSVTKEESEAICKSCQSNAGSEDGGTNEECIGCLCKTCTPEYPNKKCDNACHG